MGDTPETPAPETPTPGTVVAAKDLERDSFVETFHVREKGRRYEVAANAIANRALMQMNVAKLRVLTERAMKPYLEDEKLVPSPKDLKTLVEAVQTVDAMSNDAYSDAKKGGALANSLERLVYAATRGAAAGAGDSAKPGSNSPEARMKRLNSIGKKKAPEETVVELDE